MGKRKWSDSDLKALTARRDAGETYVSIGADLGVSPSRARQLVQIGGRLRMADWMFANGWTVERSGGRWINPPHPWPVYDKPVY